MLGVITPPDSSPTEGPRKGSYCTVKWHEALNVCRQNLGENDYEKLDQVENCDNLLASLPVLQEMMGYPTGPSLVQRLRPSFDSLRSFVTLLAAAMGSTTIQTALIWGIMSLVIQNVEIREQAAGRTETLLPETIDMLKDLGHDLEIFRIYESTFANNTQMGDELMDIFVDIITFWTQAIHFLRRNKYGATASKSWPSVHKKFEETSKRIRKRSQQIKEKAKALASMQPRKQADLLTELDRLGLLASNVSLGVRDDNAVFPCHNIPFPKNPHFYGRERELGAIRGHLDEGKLPGFRSFALFGTGGIGKTQTALTYAHEKACSGVDAVLWLNCETGLSIARSFYEIAAMLQLEGLAEGENLDQNRFLVLKWLRKTAASWLMIMDNVEDIALIRNAWPVASHGAILVTSRNDIVSIDPAAGGMEIEVFKEDDGSSFLMTLIGRESYSADERGAARQLSARLGGLPLALATMASQIRLRRKSIADFLVLYERHPRQLHKERRGIEAFYKLSLVSCWQTAFEFLGDDASVILGIVALVAPDSIPETLFKLQDSSSLPSELSFCEDEWAFGEALEELLSTSLIKRDPSTGMLFVHRLIQEEYRDFIGRDEQQKYFNRASMLLQAGFPKLINGLPLRNDWSTCKIYIQHVLILCARYQECKFRPLTHGEFDLFLELMCACGWYLMECGAWSEELELMRTAMELCEDKEGLVYANLANSLGLTECERSHVADAHEYMDESLRIRQKLLPKNHAEIANSLNNYANIILQDLRPGACEKAIELYNECIAICMTRPEVARNKFLHIPHTNISRALRIMKRYDESIEHANISRSYAVAHLGSFTHFDGLADFQIGNALYDKGEYDEAERYWTRALQIFTKDNETHPTTTAAKLKLSCIDMKRGNFDEAISSLHRSLVVAELNEVSKGDKGETARVTRKLAEAYELKGDRDTAKDLKESAESMRREIQRDRFEELPDEDISYAMMNFHAFW